MGLSCGIDIVEIERIKKALERARFIDRVYTDREVDYCVSRKTGRHESFAARFAAKEAALKALDAGALSFRDIEVAEAEAKNGGRRGKPEILLHGGAKAKYDQMMAKSISLSMSHCRDYAVATVVIEI